MIQGITHWAAHSKMEHDVHIGGTLLMVSIRVSRLVWRYLVRAAELTNVSGTKEIMGRYNGK